MSILDGMLSKGADKERADFAKFWEFFYIMDQMLFYPALVILKRGCFNNTCIVSIILVYIDTLISLFKISS